MSVQASDSSSKDSATSASDGTSPLEPSEALAPPQPQRVSDCSPDEDHRSPSPRGALRASLPARTSEMQQGKLHDHQSNGVATAEDRARWTQRHEEHARTNSASAGGLRHSDSDESKQDTHHRSSLLRKRSHSGSSTSSDEWRHQAHPRRPSEHESRRSAIETGAVSNGISDVALQYRSEEPRLALKDEDMAVNGVSRRRSSGSDMEEVSPISNGVEKQAQQPFVTCRVKWCTREGLRYGLCWSHGGGEFSGKRQPTQLKMRRGNGANGGGGGRGGNWRQFQQQHPREHQSHHAQYHQPYPHAQPPPPQHQQQQQPQPPRSYAHAPPLPPAPPMVTGAPPLPALGAAGTVICPGVQEEVTAFVHALRTSRSHPSAPPNALSFSNVSHAICVHFQVNDLEELLGVPPLQLSILRQLHTLNQRLWTFVTCFVQGRRINTLYECFQMFLMQEGIREFHELRIGNSFLHTEAVQTLYHGPTAMLNVSTRDILSHLRQFETMIGHDAFRSSTHIDRGEFLQYLSQQYRQPNVEKLGIALDPSGFGVYIGMLRRISNQEMKEMKTMEQEFQKGIAEAVFELSKEKFSAANRKKALDELLKSHLGTANDQEQDASGGGATEQLVNSGQWKKRAGANTNKSSTASLSLEMLKRVTDIDVYLDNVLRRKAASEQRNNQMQISSQEIAETDLKIRNQLTRFLVATQKSKHHSRIKVVTWVLCGIMAKIHSLLLHDDKLPDEKATDGEEDDEGKVKSDKKKKVDDGDDDDSDDECDCCCVGKDTCKCDCKCECHSNSSDEEEEEEKEDKPLAPKSTASIATSKSSKPFTGTNIFDADSVKQEVEQYLTNYCESNDIESLDQLLMCFISLEIHLRQTMGSDRNQDRSALELVLDLWNDVADSKKDGDDGDKTKVWFQTFDRLLSSQSSGLSSSNNTNDREEIAQFIQQCFVASTSSSSSRSTTKAELVQQVASRAQCEFGFDAFQRLRAESMDALLEEARQSVEEKENAEVNTSSGIVKYSSVLLPASEFHQYDQGTDNSNSSGVISSFPGESLRLKKTEEAIEALLQCPFLVDVAKFTCWQQSFAPYCGSLRFFIRTHEMMLADHASSSSRSLMFLFCLHGVVLRVNEESTPSALEMLISASSDQVVPPHHVAVHLMSMLVKNGGQQNFPKQLVQAHLKSLFAVVKARQDNDNALQPLERYVLEVLLAVPVEFAGFVYSLLAEIAAESASAQARFAEQVWSSCGNDSERRALAAIAKSSRNVVWMDRQLKFSQDQAVDIVMSDVSSSVSIENVDGSSSSSLQLQPSSSSGEFASAGKVDVMEISDRFVRAQQSSPSPPAATEPTTAPNSPEESSLAVASSSAESCRECIDTIRKEQFGIGLEILDEATSSVLTIQQKRLERALKRLSDELYSENTHFVLELLQNADDNSYDQGTRAKSEFVLTSAQEVVFHNNERGFSSANIQAICDVGASTKAAQDSSTSIGKKGIGFKSVFKISDCPQVHSNGFHIRFHSKSDAHGGGGLGYILPFWIDDKAEWQLQKGTTFVLPLNPSSLQRVDEISESLMAFEPSILLFLRRIQELRIADQVHRQTLHFLKEVSTRERHQTVQLFSQIGRKGSDRVAVSQQQWLVVKRKLQAPAAFATTADQVRETEIAIALPLDLSSNEVSGDRPPLQQVFAYLPLRSYGFRFIVQGDFEVPSSREAIVNGSEWNQWLISQVPGLMRQVVMCFVDELKVSNAATDVVAQVTHLLSLFPFENEIQAPFRSIVLDTMREISQIAFLPAALTSIENPSSLELVKPVQLLDAWEAVQDDEVLNVLTSDPDLLFATLNKKLLHLEFSKSLQPQQKNQLKIERLKASHILQLLAHAAAKNDVAWAVEILRVLGKLWKRDRHSDLLLQELRLIKCFPLQSQDAKKKWVSLMETGDALFLPSVGNGEKSSSSGGSANRDSSSSESFYGDLHVLDNDFAQAISNLPDARSFLIAQVKIKMIEDHDLISHHILPKMELLGNSQPSAAIGSDENLQFSKTVGTLKRYSKFLASHLLTCSNCPVEVDIQAKMRVWTCTGNLVPASAPNVFVMLPVAMAEMPELSRWLQAKLRASDSSSRSFDMVGCDYFEGSQTEPSSANRSGSAWQKLFVDTLKLPMLIDVTDVRVAVAIKHVLKWLHAEANLQVKENLSRELAGYLNKHWPTVRGDTDGDGALQGDETVAKLLRKTRWLSGTDGKFHRPDMLWVSTSASKSLFSESMVPYSRVTWTNGVLMEDVLKLKRTPTLEDALSVLSSLSSRMEDNELLDVSSVSRIYMFLAEQAQQAPANAQAVKQAFSEQSLVFTSPSEDAGDDGRSSGFMDVKDVVWSSTSCNGRLIPLEQSYPKSLRHFFTEVCGVEKKPSIHSLCERLEQLQNENFDRDHDAKKQWKREMLPVLQFFAKQITKPTLLKDELRRIRKTLKVTPWLPVSSSASEHKKLQWCTAKDEPIVPATDDERELQKIVLSLQKDLGSTVQSTEQIKLVKMDQELLEELDPLIKLSKIRSLTAHAVSEPSAWSDLISAGVSALDLAQEEKDQKKTRRKIQKLIKTLLIIWSKAFAMNPSMWTKADKQFQWKLQQSLLLPTVRDQHFTKPADVFINDQTELSKESLAGDDSSAASLQPALPIVSLFAWDYFTESSPGTKQEATQARDFLLSFCGAKSLKAQLSYEVIVLGSHQSESALLRSKIQQSLGVAQRFLFHHHRSLYDSLPHEAILRLSCEVKCVMIDDADGLQVVHSIGKSFSVRHTPAACFLDMKTPVLYVIGAQSGREELSYEVLMELCRKCFGPQVSTSVSNLLYLASLQPSAEMMEKWLVDTQQLAPVDPAQAGTLWFSASDVAGLSSRKRSRSELEDGEVKDDSAHSEKRLRQNVVDSRTGDANEPAGGGPAYSFPPLPPLPPPSSEGSNPFNPNEMTALYPPLPASSSYPGGYMTHNQHQQQSGAFQPNNTSSYNHTLSSDQVVTVGNTMTKEEREGIGRWGEEYVYKQLVESHRDNADMAVDWVNQHEESGKPYDITVSSGGKIVEYVEVKATRTMEKAVFEISMNELDQAAVHGSSYCIYRVFNAGNDALCRVIRMKNPIALVRQKKMQLALVMQ